MLYKTGKFLLQGFIKLIGIFPLGFHHFNAKWIGWCIENVFKYRTDLVDDNLNHAFPEKTQSERDQIRHQFYIHFAKIFLEAVWFSACDRKRLRNSHIAEIINPELVNKLYDERPSIMIMSSHSGNWEIMGGACNYSYKEDFHFSDLDICSVYRKLSSKMMNEIMEDIRLAVISDRKVFTGYMESRNVLRYVFKNKDKKKIYLFTTDQRPYFNGPDHMTVNFMNRPCLTMSASAGVAKKFGMAVVYQRMLERKGGYDIEYIPICEDASKMSVEEMIDRYYKLLEEDLRIQPFNYLWTHNRWWLMN